ncbi:MAG: copper amine oxidase N-terminal domain-containing protein [Clostridiales bacterium]|nr:copper amine oxidase N-terminal domain-containing protein [Clostridiales bacterium]
MKKELKGFICGVLAAALCSSILVYGESGYENIQVAYNNIKVYKDNVLCQLVDADGNTIEPFIYNGTTYLPLRGAAAAADMDVTWDGDTKSVYLWDETEPTVSAASADTQYSGTGYTITLSDDWVQQSGESGYDLSFANYTYPGSITVYVTNDGYDNMGFYLNHIGGADGQFFLNDQVYEEMNDRYYTEYYFSADGNYHMVCYAGTDSHIYIFSFTTNDETTYYKLRDSVKNSFAAASLY